MASEKMALAIKKTPPIIVTKERNRQSIIKFWKLIKVQKIEY